MSSYNSSITSNRIHTEHAHKKIKNKGCGAGGSNTTKNGRRYEEITALDDRISIIKDEKFSKLIRFDNDDKCFTKPKNLYKCMETEIDASLSKAHGCKKPDECYIDKKAKNIFIIEKKFQQVSGSCVEKIQTGDFKLWQYNRTFNGKYRIIYIYCLSEWFKSNCCSELNYLREKEIPVFWGNSESYKDDIISYIINYK
jgi:hypothetical protein